MTFYNVKKILHHQGVIKPTATVYCQSRMYPEMETVAVVCDGVEECHGASDEGWKCSNPKMMFWGVFGSLALISVIAFIIRYWKKEHGIVKEEIKEEDLPDEWKELSSILDKETFEAQHDSEEFQENINLLMLVNKHHKNDETRIEESETFHQREVDYHGGNLAEARNCMKSNLNPSVFKIVIEDVEPGITRRCCPWLEKFLERLDQKSWAWWMFRRIKTVFTAYLDLSKDVFLMILILIAIGGVSALTDFPFKITSITVFFLCVTIFIPLIVSSLLLARDKVNDLDRSASLSEKVKIYIKTLLLSIINPLLLINDIEVNRDKIQYHLSNPAHTIALDKKQGHSTILKLLKQRQKLKRRYVAFTRVDLGFGKALIWNLNFNTKF